MFDRFAEIVGRQVARAWFFCLCVALVVIWAPSIAVFKSLDTWQLVINTLTTIITFLLVALLQNTQDRSTKALNHKLDAIIGAVIHLLRELDEVEQAQECVRDLEQMRGVEMESTE